MTTKFLETCVVVQEKVATQFFRQRNFEWKRMGQKLFDQYVVLV